MQHSVSIDSNKKTLTVQKGDTIEIELDETPTSGYNWEVDSVDQNLCELVSSDYSLYAHAGIGGGGVRTMIFRIKNSGNGTIKLKNWQRWSGDVYQSFEVAVKAS
jgi:predicted secreted protein